LPKNAKLPNIGEIGTPVNIGNLFGLFGSFGDFGEFGEE
jgi:hypothetical protein